jgi:hypothetical protein
VLLALVVVVEGYLLYRYAAFGALFHLFVHGYVGMGLGLAAHAGWRVLGARGPRPAGEVVGAAVAGHLAAAVPDVLFLAADLPHARWMDVFVAHISVHFVPAPLALALAVLALGVGAQVLATTRGRAREVLALSIAPVAVLAVGLALRSPIPSTLEDLRADPRIALTCDLDLAAG